MPSGAVERVLSRLPQAKVHPGGGWSAKCPAHEGHGDTSLSLDEGEDGRALLHCFAGCRPKQIVVALGLTMADLFERRNGGGRGSLSSPKRLEHSNTSR